MLLSVSMMHKKIRHEIDISSDSCRININLASFFVPQLRNDDA